MRIRNLSTFLLLCLLFCLLCSRIKCTRTVEISTANASEEVSTHDSSEELPTNYSSDDDDDDDDDEGQDYTMLFGMDVVLAIWIPYTGFAIMCFVAGVVVSTQWPYPNFCCGTQSMTDRSNGCCEFSLYKRNIVFAVKNIILFVLVHISGWTILLAIPATLFIWHYIAIALLSKQFHKYGWPRPRENDVEVRLAAPLDRSGESGYQDIKVARLGRHGSC